jgi:glycosyltransferase involved in cell wall biosynthesis
MRIMALSDFYPPVIGGRERNASGMAEELARRGHQVAMVTLGGGDLPAFEIRCGVRIHRVDGWKRALKRFYLDSDRPFHPTIADPGISAALRRVIRIERPQLVQSHSWLLHSFLPLKNWSAAKLVVYLHDYGLICPKKTYVHRGGVCEGPAYAKCCACASAHYGTAKGVALTSGLHISSRLFLGRVDRFLANSAAVARASRLGVGSVAPRIDVVPSFVPDVAVEGAWGTNRPAFLPPEDGYLLFVGALGDHKGLGVLLKAFEALDRSVPLVVIGTPRQDTPNRFPPGVTVVTNATHEDVMASWRRCSIGVVPSTWPEPFGQVAVEAMLSAKPVVASAIGGLLETVVHQETGLLVSPGNVDELRDALAELLDDPARRERLGRAAQVNAQRFTLSRVASQMEQIYAEVLSGEAAAA